MHSINVCSIRIITVNHFYTFMTNLLKEPGSENPEI